MKRTVSLLLALVICLSVCNLVSVSTGAETAATIGTIMGVTYKIENDEVTITGCNKYLSDIDIPADIDGYPVTAIAEEAFYDCVALSNITLPEGLKKIGANAFYNSGYYNDESNWTDGALYIGNYLINVQNDVTECDIKDGTTVIGDSAFTVLSSSEIEYGATPDSRALSSASLPSSEMSIRSLQYIEVPDVSLLSSVSIPESVKSIGNNAFENCTLLTSATFPKRMAEIGADAFNNCTSLEYVTIYERVKKIGDNAFGNCDDVKIRGLMCSYAEEYAKENSIEFEAIGCAHSFLDEWTVDYEPTEKLPGLKSRVCARCGEKGDYTPIPPTVTPSERFGDVDEQEWYYKAVDFAITNSLFSGTGENSFEPNTPMTRAMLVRVLYNMEGKPSVDGLTNIFKDVEEGAWYTDPIKWASSNGIVYGTSADTFSPNSVISRQDLAVILYRYAKLKNFDVTIANSLDSFPDKSAVDGYAVKALKWAVGIGLISGNKINGTIILDPKGNATRAQVALILKNFCEKAIDIEW